MVWGQELQVNLEQSFNSHKYHLPLDNCAQQPFKFPLNNAQYNMTREGAKSYNCLSKNKVMDIYEFVMNLRIKNSLGQRSLARKVKERFDVDFIEGTISGWIYQGLIPYANEKTQFKPKPLPKKEEIFKLYIKRKLSASKLANRYNVSTVIIINWLKHYNLRPRTHLESMNTKRIKKELRNNKLTRPTKVYWALTPEKAYILGVLAGDGFINKKLARLEIRRDVEFIEKFAYCFNQVYGIEYKYYYYKPKNSHILHATSEVICKDLLRYGDFKTNSWEVPKRVLNSKNPVIKKEYLKGLFDSEGSAQKYSVTFSSNSIKGIIGVKMILESIGIYSKIIGMTQKHHRLTITKRENLETFRKEIGFVMQRKTEKLRW